ncbi:MAG: glycosyltransferase [Verrucomicrobiia bacterium]
MRIVIATVAVGAGHLQAAAALEECWGALRPRDEVRRIDALAFTSRLYQKFYVKSYLQLVAHAPELWGHVFKKTDNPALVQKITRIRRTFAKLKTGGFVRQLRQLNPDAVLCTHYLPLEVLGAIKAKAAPHCRPLAVSIVTDFEAHALWMEPGVDLYCVAADETKARLVARGASPDTVVVTGIPISAQFSRALNTRAIRKQLGLRDDLPVLLVLGGGFGLGPVAGILKAMNQLQTQVQVLVVCGRNDELRKELAIQEYQHPTRVLGFVTNMHEFMAIADLIITKPGGLTTSESLALGKPILILDPIPGQEAANSDFLLEHGAAAKITRVEDLPYRLEKLLGSRRLAAMVRAARALGRPRAARMVCEEVLHRMGVEVGNGSGWPE